MPLLPRIHKLLETLEEVLLSVNGTCADLAGSVRERKLQARRKPLLAASQLLYLRVGLIWAITACQWLHGC